MADRNLCDEVLVGDGDFGPSGEDDPENIVGRIRAEALPTIDKLKSLEEYDAENEDNEEDKRLIFFRDYRQKYYATALMKERLIRLAQKVADFGWEGGQARKLYVFTCLLPIESKKGLLHWEARVATLQTVKVDPLQAKLIPEDDLSILQKIACFCQEVDFEHIALRNYGDKLYTYAYVSRDPLNLGEPWPSDDIALHVGQFRYAIPTAKDVPEKLNPDKISYDKTNDNNGRTTLFMKQLLEKLADEVKLYWGGEKKTPKKLKVNKCYDPCDPTDRISKIIDEQLHSAARIAELSLEPLEVGDKGIKELQILGRLCQNLQILESNGQFIEFGFIKLVEGNNPYILAAVRRDDLQPGETWPIKEAGNEEIEELVGGFRYAFRSNSDLSRIDDKELELVAFPKGENNPGYATRLMVRLLTILAKKVPLVFGGNRKLFIQECYVPGDGLNDNLKKNLHNAARIAKLKIQYLDEVSPDLITNDLQKLARLCQDINFGYVEFSKDGKPFIHAAVIRDNLLDENGNLESGNSWPTKYIFQHVGQTFQPESKPSGTENLAEIESDSIVFPEGSENVKFTTGLMKFRLEEMARHIKKKIGPGSRLKVNFGFIPDLDESASAQRKLHAEARIVDLKIQKYDDEDSTDSSLLKLASLCQENWFEYLEFRSDGGALGRYIHAAVPRANYLFSLHKLVSVDLARTKLTRGWQKFAEWVMVFQGAPTIQVNGPGISLSPIFFEDNGAKNMLLGDILLSAANFQGLYPKAYFREPQDRLGNQVIIRLIPSPLADLATVLSPVSIGSLELSLKRYSDIGNKFKHSEDPLAEVLEKLTEAGGRYSGIEFHIQNVLKSQTIDVEQPPHASLTQILDAIAYQVHASWHWTGQNRIDIISRPYSEYIDKS